MSLWALFKAVVLSFIKVFNINKWSAFLLCLFLLNPSISWGQQQATDYEHNVNSLIAKQGLIAKETNTKKKVLVMGDSLSAAYGINQESGWVALLQNKQPRLDIVNASISGETTSGGLQRLPVLMNRHQPDILVLELGANDALRGQNLRVTKQNLQKMISACKNSEKSCRVILLGVQLPTNYGPAYDMLFQKMYRDLAEKNKLLFDPFFLEDVALDPDLMQADGLHPNAAAQPVILQRVLPLFEKAQSSFLSLNK